MSDDMLSRPTTMDEVSRRHRLLFTPASLLRAMRLKPRPSDVFVAPFMKCGTTWLQQIVHSLRSRGDLEFDDICRVVPWLEAAEVLGIDLDAPQEAEPRAFKTHLPWKLVPKGGRYIVALRDPKDVVVSAYRFFDGWFFEPGSISMQEWAEHWFIQRKGGGDYWAHLLSWWEQRNRADVLLLAYEQMIKNPAGAVEVIAKFLDIALDDELRAIVVDQSSLATMKRNRSRYNDRMMREAWSSVAQLPPPDSVTKVRKGQVGSHRAELPAALAAALDEIWRESVLPATGAHSYDELIAALPRPAGGSAP